MRKILTFAVLIGVAVAAFYFFGKSAKRTENIPQISNIPSADQSEEQVTVDVPRLSVLSKNLQIPWSLVFLPDGEILFTERPGRVRVIGKDGKLADQPVATIGEVKHIGEGGLLGIELHPDFNDNKFVYLYYTYGENNGNTLNRVARFKFNGKSLSQDKVIVDAIPGASNHNGGRIKFGPDGFLYITTGDAQEPSRSQDTSSLAGKILRVTDEGQAAPGNPFNNRTYSYGHRNPQGITWDNTGALWETEHGSSATDELNKVEVGKNYGWPDSRGDEVKDGTIKPMIHSGSSTWAPSGMAFTDGSIYYAGLRGVSLFEYEISSGKLTRHLNGELGRIREVVLGADNMLYITTNNHDGRGNPSSDDDRIIRVNPAKL